MVFLHPNTRVSGQKLPCDELLHATLGRIVDRDFSIGAGIPCGLVLHHQVEAVNFVIDNLANYRRDQNWRILWLVMSGAVIVAMVATSASWADAQPYPIWASHDNFVPPISDSTLGCGFKYFFSPRKLGKMNPIWRIYFSEGLVQRLTTNQNLLGFAGWESFCTVNNLVLNPGEVSTLDQGVLHLPFWARSSIDIGTSYEDALHTHVFGLKLFPEYQNVYMVAHNLHIFTIGYTPGSFTASLRLKSDGWKTIRLPFWGKRPIFQGTC